MESGCSTFGFALGEEKKWNIDDSYLKYGFALEEFSLKKKIQFFKGADSSNS